MVNVLCPEVGFGFAGDKVFGQQALQVSVRSSVFSSEVVLCGDSESQEHVDGAQFLVVDGAEGEGSIGLLFFFDADPDDAGDITDVGVHGCPDLAAFPESVVGGVGSEGENQTNDNTQ